MEIAPESLLDIGKQLGQVQLMIGKCLELEERVRTLEIELKAIQKSTHEVQFMPAAEQTLPGDDLLDEYQEDPMAKQIARKLFGTVEDMEDTRE